MDDREKILAWLNCYCQGNDNPDCGNCPFQYGDCAVDLPKAIKNLLQEPVKPNLVGVNTWECGECGNVIGWECFFITGVELTQCKYCPNCGRKVKWE